MRGYGGDPYDPRRRQQMEDGNVYLPGNSVNNHSSSYPVEARLPYPNALAASAYMQMPQQPHSIFASPRHMPYDAAGYNHYQDPQRYGRMAPPTNNLHDGLVPPNLMPQHPPPPLNVYDLPISPLRQSVASPNNMVSVMDQHQQHQRPKVRYDERVQVNLRSPDASRQEDRNPDDTNRDGEDHDDEEEVKRYQEIYHQVFARHSRTPSEARTQTEHTRGTPYAQTTTSGSTSRSSTSSQSSSGISSSFSDVEDWEENIRSTLNEMAGNLKNLGGIHCNQAGPDSTELQLKLNLPVPMQYMDQLDIATKQGLSHLDMAAKQGLNTAIATLSPKKCNMQYGYDNLDEGVFDMEQRFVGTMNDLQGNVMPVYKSLFQSQSDESSAEEDEDTEMDDENEESSYEDPRFLASQTKTAPNVASERKKPPSKGLSRGNGFSRKDSPSIDRVPSHIIITDSPSDFSSADSWRLSSTVVTLPKSISKQGDIPSIVMKDDKQSFDVIKSPSFAPKQLRGDAGENNRESPDWITATKTKLAAVDRERSIDAKDSDHIARQTESSHFDKKEKKLQRKETKTKSRKVATPGEIPHTIHLVLPLDMPDVIVETLSEITTDIPDSESSQPSSAFVDKPVEEDPEAEMERSSLDGDPTKKDEELRRKVNMKRLEDSPSKIPEGDELMESRSPVQISVVDLSSHIDEAQLVEPTATESLPNQDTTVSDEKTPPHSSVEKAGAVASTLNTLTPERDFVGEDELMGPRNHNKSATSLRDEELPSRDHTNSKVDETEAKSNSNKTRDDTEPTTSTSSPKVEKASRNPLYLRAIQLRKKAMSCGDDFLVKNQRLAGENEKSVSIKSVVEAEPSPLSDAQGITPESTKKSLDGAEQSDETKLDQAIDEVFGALSDAPDDEIVKPIKTLCTPLRTTTDMDANCKLKQESDSNKKIAVAEEDGRDIPDDERPSVHPESEKAVPQNVTRRSIDGAIETASSDIPEDERLDSSTKEVPSDRAEKEHRRGDAMLDPEPLEKDEGVPSTFSTEEPFDISMDASQSEQPKNDTDKSLVHSDQSFESAKQGTASGHSTQMTKMLTTKATMEYVKTNESFDFANSVVDGLIENLTESSRLHSSLENTSESTRLHSSLSSKKEQEDGPQIPPKSKNDVRDKESRKAMPNLVPESPFDVEADELDFVQDKAISSTTAIPNNIQELASTTENQKQTPDKQVDEGHSVAEVHCDNVDSAKDQDDTGDLPSCSERTGPAFRERALESVKTKPSHLQKDEMLERLENHKQRLSGSASALVLSEGEADVTPIKNEEEAHPVSRRANRNRASLYEVQGFDEYCKNISSSTTEPDNWKGSELPAASSNIRKSCASQSSHDSLGKSSSSAHYHQRTLEIDLEDPEENCIDDLAKTTRDQEPIMDDEVGESSSIDGDAEIDETESKCSTTNTEDQSAAMSHSAESATSDRNDTEEDSVSESSYSGSSEGESSNLEEQTDIDTDASSGQESKRKDVVQNMKPVTPPNDHDLHMSATRRLRNQIDADQEQVEIRYLSQHNRATLHPLSSQVSTKTRDNQSKFMLTMDERLGSDTSKPSMQSFNTPLHKEPTSMAKSILAAYSMDTHLTSPLTSSFTMDTPLAAASTISTMHTFDHETVSSGQQSLLWRRPTHDSSSTAAQSTAHSESRRAAKSAAIPITAVYSWPTQPTSQTKGSLQIISLLSRVIFSILLFLFEWAKFFVAMCRKKRHAKVECAPARLGPRQTDQVLRREEIQERSMDSFIHRTNANPRFIFHQHQHRQPYLLHHRDEEQHVTTTMTMTPPLPVFQDDGDEVGTCVSSIVPETHYTERPSAWKVYSRQACKPTKWQKRREVEEATNWMD